MSTTPITTTELINASTDAETFEEFLNSQQSIDLISRLGTIYPTLIKAIQNIGFSSGSDAWLTSILYNDFQLLITEGGNTYRLNEVHTSGVFATDLAANKWVLYAPGVIIIDSGTWTPVISDAISGGNLGSASISAANWIRVANFVFVTALINNIDTSGMTAGEALNIQGLPFVVNQISNGEPTLDNVAFSGTAHSRATSNGTHLFFRDTISGAGDTSLLVSAFNTGIADVVISHIFTVA